MESKELSEWIRIYEEKTGDIFQALPGFTTWYLQTEAFVSGSLYRKIRLSFAGTSAMTPTSGGMPWNVWACNSATTVSLRYALFPLSRISVCGDGKSCRTLIQMAYIAISARISKGVKSSVLRRRTKMERLIITLRMNLDGRISRGKMRMKGSD